MAVKDVDIKELQFFQTYSSKLTDFRDVVVVVGVALMKKMNNLSKELEEKQRHLEQLQRHAEDAAGTLRSRYERALDADGQCRAIIGDSDKQADEILKGIKEKITKAESDIKQMQMLLENLRIRTKGFVEQVPNMVEHSRDVLNKKIDLIEQYKELHK